MGVGIGSVTGASIDVGTGVAEFAWVLVGDAITTEVAVISVADVSVGDDIEGVVDVEPLEAEVCVAVTVAVLEVGVRVGNDIEDAAVVATGFVSVTKTIVSVRIGDNGCAVFAGTHNNRQMNNNNRMMAITSLNRSYPGARVEVSMLFA